MAGNAFTTNLYRGVDMRAQFAGARTNLDTVSIDMVTDDIPAIGFEDVSPIDGFTYDDGAMGVVGHTIVGKGYWNAQQNPHGSPPSFNPGFYVISAQIFVSKVANRFYNYAAHRVLGGRMDGQMRGRVDFSFTNKSCGQIVYPV